MDRHASEALDRHITGNYGEDQLRDFFPEEVGELTCQVSGCEELTVDGVLCEIHVEEQEANS